MSVLLKAIHRDWCETYGSHVIGPLEEMHPLVVKMLEECVPKQNRINERYKACIDCTAEALHQEEPTVPKDRIEKVLKEELLPEQLFFKIMSAFALGVQYAARKTGGKAIPAKDFEFLHSVAASEDHKPFKQFGAAAVGDRIAINPAMLAEAIADPEFLKLLDHPPDLNLLEHYTLMGVEEMLHLYQNMHGKHAQYDVSNLDVEAYKNDPVEKEADILIHVAERELGLGPKYRGHKIG